MITFRDFLEATPIPGFDDLTVSRILFDLSVLLLIFLMSRLAVWFVKKILERQVFYFRNIEEGKKFAILQISKYLIYTFAIAIIFDRLHIGSIVFTSFAGLFVGLGFGIQQTFNDLTSGLILLFEGSVRVGDIIEVDSKIGRVTSIGVRYSVVQSRDDVTVIVPNSKLIVEKVTNLSGNMVLTRFHIRVGVIYGSDVVLVTEKLKEAALSHPDVLSEASDGQRYTSRGDIEPPRVYFQDFGDNSLVFDLYFWTRNIWDVDIVKSDIRYSIDQLFRENGIVIAFPQRDVHLKIDQGDIGTFKKLLSESEPGD